MVAGHSVIGNEELAKFTLDDSGALMVASGVLGIIGVGQQTPLSQGRCCKAKFRRVNATNAIWMQQISQL